MRSCARGSLILFVSLFVLIYVNPGSNSSAEVDQSTGKWRMDPELHIMGNWTFKRSMPSDKRMRAFKDDYEVYFYKRPVQDGWTCFTLHQGLLFAGSRYFFVMQVIISSIVFEFLPHLLSR